MTKSSSPTTHGRRVLSIEAADELLRYLYLLIDEIQFECESCHLENEYWEEAVSQEENMDWVNDQPPF